MEAGVSADGRLKAGRVPRSPTTYLAIGSRFYRRAPRPQASRVVFEGDDDATVVEVVADKARQALDDFMTWETAPPSG